MSALRWANAQADAIAVLAAALVVPGSEFVARHVRTPTLEEEVVAGVPTTVVRPSSKPPWPALVFANGATREGRRHRIVRRLAWGLGWGGYLLYVPDLPGVAAGEVTEESLRATIAVAAHAAGSPEARDGRVGLAGVSTGATLSLLAASSAQVAERVSVVAAVAPFADLGKVIMLATTGVYRGEGGLERYSAPPYLLVAVTRSLAATLPPSPPRERLCAELQALAGDAADPLAPFGRQGDALGPEGAAIRSLLANRDPDRFDGLYAGLPEATRQAVEALSPVRTVAGLRAPAEIVTPPRDKYFPIDEAAALARAAPRARLTITGILSHATPKFSPSKALDLARLDGFIVRSLAATRS